MTIEESNKGITFCATTGMLPYAHTHAFETLEQREPFEMLEAANRPILFASSEHARIVVAYVQPLRAVEMDCSKIFL